MQHYMGLCVGVILLTRRNVIHSLWLYGRKPPKSLVSWLSSMCLNSLSIEDNVIVCRQEQHRMVNMYMCICMVTYGEFKSRLFPTMSAEAALPSMPELTLLDDVDDVNLTR